MLSVDAKGAVLLFCQIMTTTFLTACLSWFLWLCMREGMILRPYYLFLEKLSNKSKFFDKVLSKPLGHCVYCYSTWVITVYIFFDNWYYFEYLTLFWGANYFWINVLSKLE